SMGSQEEMVTARKAELIADGRVRECPSAPSLVLGKGAPRIEVSSSRSIQLSQLALLTADSIDVLSCVRHFDEVAVKARRAIEADPFKALQSFSVSAGEIPIIAEMDDSTGTNLTHGAPESER